MTALAWHGGGPGPWVLLIPLVWAAVVAGVITAVRRAGWRGGQWRHVTGGGAGGENSPMAVLGRRFAAGEIDEEEYWRRMSVLEEHFARAPRGRKGGAA